MANLCATIGLPSLGVGVSNKDLEAIEKADNNEQALEEYVRIKSAMAAAREFQSCAYGVSDMCFRVRLLDVLSPDVIVTAAAYLCSSLPSHSHRNRQKVGPGEG